MEHFSKYSKTHKIEHANFLSIEYTIISKMIEIQINLIVNPKKMEQVYELLCEDENNALTAKDVFYEFNISKNKNRIDIKALCHTMDALSKHMMNTHYRWKDLKTNGAIISQTHRFVEL